MTNLAQAGATVERYAYEPKHQGLPPSILTNTLKEEIDTLQGSKYGRGDPFKDWQTNSSLFATWFGVNEVLRSFEKHGVIPFDAVFATYLSSFDRLYTLGARFFLIINIAPIDVVVDQGMPLKTNAADNIDEFNSRLGAMHKRLLSRHRDAKFFLFDVHSLWTKIMHRPESAEQTAGLKTVDAFCPYYGFHATSVLEHDANCTHRLDEYFWLDHVHATHIVHNATAAAIVHDCFHQEGPHGYCTDTRDD